MTRLVALCRWLFKRPDFNDLTEPTPSREPWLDAPGFHAPSGWPWWLLRRDGA